MADRRDIGALRIAILGELRASAQVRAARHHADKLIDRAVADGASYDEIAREMLKMRLGKAPTAQQRVREANRLRQRRWKYVTGGNGDVVGAGLNTSTSSVGFSAKEDPMSRLIRKTTTIEEFDADDGIKHEAEAEPDAECADAGDEDDDEEEDDEDEGDDDEE